MATTTTAHTTRSTRLIPLSSPLQEMVTITVMDITTAVTGLEDTHTLVMALEDITMIILDSDMEGTMMEEATEAAGMEEDTVVGMEEVVVVVKVPRR